MWNCNNPYADRDESLKRLGFKSYREYIGSDFWKSIRSRVLKRSNGACERCGSRKVIQVHHRAYDIATLAGTNINSLSAVCRQCHCEAEQPQNFTRTRYERLVQASHVIAATPIDEKWELKCRRWYQRHEGVVQKRVTTEAQVRLVEAIRDRALDHGIARCIGCGRKGCNPRVPVKIVGRQAQFRFCGHHSWNEVRAYIRAILLVREGEQYPLAGRSLGSVVSELTATDGDTAAASGPAMA